MSHVITSQKNMSHQIHPSKKALYGQRFILFFNDFFYFAGDNTLASFGKNIEGLIASLGSECDPRIGLMKTKLL